MGQRIGALWRRDKDGVQTITGTMESDVGVNLPAGAKLGISIVKNDKKVEGDNLPDFHLEAWVQKERQG